MKTKYYSMYGKAVDANGAEHIVTVVGKFNQTKTKSERLQDVRVTLEDDNDVELDGYVVVPFKQTLRTLKLGYSICHPNDTFNEEEGVRVAKRRINSGDYIGELSTNNVTMLNEDQCNLSVFGELNYIIKNINKYLPNE